jgi:hypothetical protein
MQVTLPITIDNDGTMTDLVGGTWGVIGLEYTGAVERLINAVPELQRVVEAQRQILFRLVTIQAALTQTMLELDPKGHAEAMADLKAALQDLRDYIAEHRSIEIVGLSIESGALYGADSLRPINEYLQIETRYADESLKWRRRTQRFAIYDVQAAHEQARALRDEENDAQTRVVCITERVLRTYGHE